MSETGETHRNGYNLLKWPALLLGAAAFAAGGYELGFVNGGANGEKTEAQRVKEQRVHDLGQPEVDVFSEPFTHMSDKLVAKIRGAFDIACGFGPFVRVTNNGSSNPNAYLRVVYKDNSGDKLDGWVEDSPSLNVDNIPSC